MDRKIIFIDIDNTINELTDTLLQLYGEKYNHNLRIGDITDYDLKLFLKKDCENIFKEFCTNEVILGLNMVPNAKEVIEQLMSKHDVYFVTAGHPSTIRGRDEWLGKHIAGYSSSQLIMCSNKTLLRGHLLIDDYWYNHMGNNIEWNILVDQPYNKQYKDKMPDNMVMCKDWEEIKRKLHDCRWL